MQANHWRNVTRWNLSKLSPRCFCQNAPVVSPISKEESTSNPSNSSADSKVKKNAMNSLNDDYLLIRFNHHTDRVFVVDPCLNFDRRFGDMSFLKRSLEARGWKGHDVDQLKCDYVKWRPLMLEWILAQKQQDKQPDCLEAREKARRLKGTLLEMKTSILGCLDLPNEVLGESFCESNIQRTVEQEHLQSTLSTSRSLESDVPMLGLRVNCAKFLSASHYHPINCSSLVRPAILRGCALNLADAIKLNDGGSTPTAGCELYLVGNSFVSLAGFLCSKRLSPKSPLPIKMYQIGTEYTRHRTTKGRPWFGQHLVCQVLNGTLDDTDCSFEFITMKEEILQFLTDEVAKGTSIQSVTVAARHLTNAEMTRVDFVSEKSGLTLASVRYYGDFVSRRLRIQMMCSNKKPENTEIEADQKLSDTPRYLHLIGATVNFDAILRDTDMLQDAKSTG